MLDGLFTFVGLLEPDGTIVEANRTACEAAGIRREDVLGMPIWESPWWDTTQAARDQVRTAVDRARAGETIRYDLDVRLAGDQVIRMDFQLVPLVEDGVVTGLIPSGIDIDDRRREGERLQAFARFARALAVAVHSDDVAQAVGTYLARALGASFANLALLDPHADEVRLVHDPTLDKAIAERYVTIPLHAPTPLTDAIRSGRTVIVEDDAAREIRYPHLSADTVAAGLVSTASVPLTFDGTRIGAIGVAWSTEIDLVLDPTFADRLTTIAELTAETLARSRASDTRSALMASLQRQVLPHAPEAPELDLSVRYLAAGASLGFGGDWYDVISLDEHRTAVVVGDVVGHGIEAAARMVAVRSALNAVVRLGTPLEDTFTVAGPLIDEPDPAFVGTAVVLVVDTEAGTIRYTSAGHPPVVVRAPDGTTRLLDDVGGIVLGVGERDPAAGSVPFPPGAVAVAYTDGLVETRTSSIDDGIRRLCAVLEAEVDAGAGTDRISDELVASTGGAADLLDDVALVVICHRPPG
jgi:PAS domain S-box-containing protein